MQAHNNHIIPSFKQFKDWIHAVSFSPDGRRLAAADMSGLVHVWSFDE